MLVAMLSQASASRPRNAVPPVRRRVADYINREVRLTTSASRPLSVERTKFGNNIPSIRAFRMFALGHVVVRN